MKPLVTSVLASLLFFTCFSQVGLAASKTPNSIKLIFNDRTVALNFYAQPQLIEQKPVHAWSIGGTSVPLNFLDNAPPELAGLEIDTVFRPVVSRGELENFFQRLSLLSVDESVPVEIGMRENGYVSFDGRPDTHFSVDFDSLVPLINEAIVRDHRYVRVPAEKTFSPVIADAALRERGIVEVIALGESNFYGSSPERRQNILAGTRKFNGVIIPQGEQFSFNQILKSVDPADGFVEELVIKGNDTEKEFGGGVCQVSTTVFRAAFSGGLPIDKRRNHSYAVPYYKPHGLDATIYLGGQDFRFTNDTPGDLLIQAFAEGNRLYFAFYGTSDGRSVAFEGPFISGYKPAPDPIIEETTVLPPGETAELSAAHDGFHAAWTRQVNYPTHTTDERFNSSYKAWPARVLRGVGPEPDFTALEHSTFAPLQEVVD